MFVFISSLRALIYKEIVNGTWVFKALWSKYSKKNGDKNRLESSGQGIKTSHQNVKDGYDKNTAQIDILNSQSRVLIVFQVKTTVAQHAQAP